VTVGAALHANRRTHCDGALATPGCTLNEPAPVELPVSAAKRRRRAMILKATAALASEGGYDVVQMRLVAKRAGIATGTLYRYFPSKVHLLVSLLGRAFERLDASHDWAAIGGTPHQRLCYVISLVNGEWRRQPALTEAVTRAFVFADATAAAEVEHAANVIEGVLARTISGGAPGEEHHDLARVICDVWLSNLTGWLTQRASPAEACRRLDHAIRLLVGDDAEPKI
jgi:AcrR family transcriptional regulator